MKKLTSMILLQLLLLVIVNVVTSQEISPGEITEQNQIQRIFHTEPKDHHEDEDHDIDDHEHEDNVHDKDHSSDFRTWIYASLALFLISLCGVFGVIIIPIMQKIFYQHLLQFLIALAVGTLAGDALLHLLPHALQPHHQHGHDRDHHADREPDDHNRAVWLGLVAAAAVILFYFFEKFINIIQEWRTRRKTSAKSSENLGEEKEVRKPPIIVREGHEASDKVRGESKCIQKYSSYCVGDLDRNKDSAGSGWEESKDNNNDKKKERVIISQHEVPHHGHSHAHSHVHSAPRTIASVAWMVILGDGIHNMADGMAIGVAFASGPWSGVSTSVAVLCHELPHEIGDFAMLLKAGMSVKQAIFYNLLSSVLAYVGMVTGILLGQISDVTPWIFSATAGIFLYVALVDMIPELGSGHAHPLLATGAGQESGHWLGLGLQLLGMVTGLLIMLAIALSETWVKEVISGAQAH